MSRDEPTERREPARVLPFPTRLPVQAPGRDGFSDEGRDAEARPAPPIYSVEGVPLIDPARLRRAALGDAAFRTELAGLFFLEADRLAGELRRAHALGSSEAAVRAAHLLRGAATVVGAVQIGELARKAEAVASSGGLELLGPILDRLDPSVRETRRALAGEPAQTD